MTTEAQLAQIFDHQRHRLLALAYRVLGSWSDAEDVVQEAWLRLSRQDADEIENLPGWLTTVVSRICIDTLRSRAARPEVSLDADLPELVVTDDVDTPEDTAVLADSIGLALLVVLGSLRPDERLAFVLHDMFAVPFAEIGPILDRSADAAKMLASRARRKVQDVPRPAGPPRGGRCIPGGCAGWRFRCPAAGARSRHHLAPTQQPRGTGHDRIRRGRRRDPPGPRGAHPGPAGAGERRARNSGPGPLGPAAGLDGLHRARRPLGGCRVDRRSGAAGRTRSARRSRRWLTSTADGTVVFVGDHVGR